MGLSLANTMSPYMGRGPTVVIRGGFALGVVRGAGDEEWSLFTASRIQLVGLATAVQGQTFRFLVQRRTMFDGQASRFFGGYSSIVHPSSGIFPNPNLDYPSVVRLTNDGSNNGDGPYAAEAQTTNALRDAETRIFNTGHPLGTLRVSDAYIAIYGALASLNLGAIRAVGFVPQSGGGYAVTTRDIWYDGSANFIYHWPDQSPYTLGNGWRTLEVHVFDNPGLQGHVTGISSDRLFWDC